MPAMRHWHPDRGRPRRSIVPPASGPVRRGCAVSPRDDQESPRIVLLVRGEACRERATIISRRSGTSAPCAGSRASRGQRAGADRGNGYSGTESSRIFPTRHPEASSRYPGGRTGPSPPGRLALHLDDPPRERFPAPDRGGSPVTGRQSHPAPPEALPREIAVLRRGRRAGVIPEHVQRKRPTPLDHIQPFVSHVSLSSCGGLTVSAEILAGILRQRRQVKQRTVTGLGQVAVEELQQTGLLRPDRHGSPSGWPSRSG